MSLITSGIHDNHKRGRVGEFLKAEIRKGADIYPFSPPISRQKATPTHQPTQFHLRSTRLYSHFFESENALCRKQMEVHR
jgi:hypothetical protein